MKRLFSLSGLVLFLILVSGTGIYYKHKVLGVPLLPDEERGRWLLEARVAYEAEGKPVKVVLALPGEGWESRDEGQPVSLDYGFSRDLENGREVGIWSAREPKNRQVLYYRVTVGQNESRLIFPRAKDEEVPVVNGAGASGAHETALSALESRSRMRSSDGETFVKRVQEFVAENSDDEAYTFLQRYYEGKYPNQWQSALVTDVLKQGGVPCRACVGVRLSEERGMQDPLNLLEYFDADENVWRVISPNGESLEKVMVWTRGESLVEVYGGKNSTVHFSASKERAPTGVAERLKDASWWVGSITALPSSERAAFRYVALIPLGVLAVVLLRNIVGLATLGTFMPVLLALAFLELRLDAAMIMLASMLAGGLVFRAMLSNFNLLVVPRVAACVVIVTIFMMAVSLISFRLGAVSGLRVTVFPMIVLAWTIERMSLSWEEEGAFAALMQVFGSLIAAAAAYGMMKIEVARYWVEFFPEVLLILLAIILMIGRYTGYRLMELVRFRNAAFTEA